MINLYIMQSRGVVDMFNHAYGLYADTWSAWVELLLNVGITIGIGIKYGIVGLLLGKIVSTFVIVVLWKPFYLFSKGFHLPIFSYWKGVMRYNFIFIISFGVVYLLILYFSLSPEETIWGFIKYGFYLVTMYLIINIPLFYYIGYGTKDFIKRWNMLGKIFRLK